MKRAAVDELRSEEVARLSPLGRLRADSHDIEEGSQRGIHPAIELLDEMTPRSEDKEEVLTPINNIDEDCSWLFESQSSGVLEGVGDRLWWHSNSWHDLDERRKDWLSNHQSFNPATTKDLMSSLNPDLCKFCRIFFDDWASIIKTKNESESRANHFGAVHYDTFDELSASALDGCNLCTLFSSILQLGQEHKNLSGFPKELSPAGFLELREKNDDEAVVRDIDTWWIRLHLINPGASEEESFIQSEEMEPVIGLTCRNPSQAQRTDSPFVLDAHSSQLNSKPVADPLLLPRRWLEECRSEHEACRNNDQPKAPTRLIKIDNGVVQLCLSAEQKCLPTYATLSHCWGKLTFLQLLKSNISLFMDRIPLVGLSKTFLDSIEIARSLGFSWLWIDSLCIIQDDEEDWQREASLMATVYGQSGLNIAATAAPDGQTGCLFPRDPVWAQKRQINVEVDGETRTYDYADFRLLLNSVFHTPLNSRAWVLQERLLAPRTLHFGPIEIVWECRTKYACGAFPEGVPKSFAEEPFGISKTQLSINWDAIVFLYSRCLLTHESDKLVALAGVARKVCQESGDEYFSGLWKRSLQKDLCWSKFLKYDPKPQLKPRIPSWSWAAVRGQVASPKPWETPLHSYMRVVDVRVTLTGSDPFGDVDRGILTLSSKHMTSCWADLPHEEEKRGLNFDEVLLGNWSLEPIRGQVRWDYAENYCSECVLFLVDIRNLLESERYKKDRVLNALILKKTGKEKGQYERLGLFQVSELEGDRIKYLDVVLERISEVDDFPTEDCISVEHDAEGTKWYTVTIV